MIPGAYAGNRHPFAGCRHRIKCRSTARQPHLLDSMSSPPIHPTLFFFRRDPSVDRQQHSCPVFWLPSSFIFWNKPWAYIWDVYHIIGGGHSLVFPTARDFFKKLSKHDKQMSLLEVEAMLSPWAAHLSWTFLNMSPW